ncbi:hypothetical protein [Saccharothrix stipae]
MEQPYDRSADSQSGTTEVERADVGQMSTRVGITPEANGDPVTWFGFLHRAIDDRKRFIRLCLLLVLATGALIGLGVLAPELLTLIVQGLAR